MSDALDASFLYAWLLFRGAARSCQVAAEVATPEAGRLSCHRRLRLYTSRRVKNLSFSWVTEVR